MMPTIHPLGNPPTRSRRGFTLIEVLLSILIVLGTLTTAFYFYHQVAGLRRDVLEQSSKLATMRLLMDRITQDLRSTYAGVSYSFRGNAHRLLFLTCAIPASGRSDFELPPTTQVEYSLLRPEPGTNSPPSGLARVEYGSSSPFAGSVASGAEGGETLALDEVPRPMTDVIRNLTLRYWTGASWESTWDREFPPLAVEVTFGELPATEEPAPAPSEIFRRVVAIPTGRPAAPVGLSPSIEAAESEPSNL